MGIFEFSSSVLYEGHEGIGVRGKWSVAGCVKGGSEMTFERYQREREYQLQLFSKLVDINEKTDKKYADIWRKLGDLIDGCILDKVHHDTDEWIEYNCYEDFMNGDVLMNPSSLVQKMYELSWQPY